MSRYLHSCSAGGYSLIELLVTLAVLGICLAVGTLSLTDGLRMQEARGAAQSWQAAAAWAQVGVLWEGGSSEASYLEGAVSVTNTQGLCGGEVSVSAPTVPVTTNVPRWMVGSCATVDFVGNTASPDGGGSLYFRTGRTGYRVAVRPETGLTVRSPMAATP